jgi:hypothetical protein
MIQQDMIPDINVVASPHYRKSCVVIGGSYRGSTGVLLKETKCRYKLLLSGGREVYLKKDNVKCEDGADILTDPYVHLHALVVGGSYKGSTGVLVKETDCRYKIQFSTGREVYLKKSNVKFQKVDDPGDVWKANDVIKFQYHFNCLMALFNRWNDVYLA